ncbi:MAG: ABC transporter ATP-binding protein [Desulfitobacteriaceae bacterium]
MATKEKLVEIKDLKKHFKVKGDQIVKAVDDISLDIYKGETVGFVGESGCGKSTAGRTILRLYEPTSGEVLFKGENIYHKNSKQMLKIRREMQMIFQDPYASINPRMTCGDVIGEAIDIHNLARGKVRQERIYELLNLVGLNKEHANRFAHEFSGGQRQRIGIARALAVQPEFVICDEPISALDVSIQAQVVNLLEDLQKDLGLTYLFIAHDLAMVKHISNRIAVMYLGKIVELSESNELYKHPLHPYTQALLSAIPIPDPKVKSSRQRIILEGDVPSPINPPSGCHFRTRCQFAKPECAEIEPVLREARYGHFVSCHIV